MRDLATYVSIGAVAVFIIFVAIAMQGHRHTFMTDCLADGKKRYECEALFAATLPQTQTIYVVK